MFAASLQKFWAGRSLQSSSKCWRLVEGRNVSILNSPDLDVPHRRKNTPASPHLNSKAERSPKADKIEFCGTIHISSGNPGMLLAEWPHYHNWDRPHSAHKRKTPTERCCELMAQAPVSREVADACFPEKEDIREQNPRLDSNSNIETLSMNHANQVQSRPGCDVGSLLADVNYN